MRAVLLIATLCLAACSSTIPTSNVNPSAATRTHLAHMDTSGITFDLRSYFGVGVTTIVSSKILIQKCIASITPDEFSIRGGEFKKISIVASGQGTCKDAPRGAELFFTSVSLLGFFAGVIHVTYAPTPGTWTAKLDLADKKWKLCSEPPGLDTGIQIENNSNIALKFC